MKRCVEEYITCARVHSHSTITIGGLLLVSNLTLKKLVSNIFLSQNVAQK